MSKAPRTRRIAPLIAASLLFVAGCSAGTEAGGREDTTTTSSAESAHSHDDREHDDSTGRLREWEGSPPPVVLLTLESDGSEGRVLAIDAPGFTFTPASVTEPVAGEGHAHLYVDGELLTMIYRHSYVLPQLPPDARVLTVTLSTNDHLEYAVDGVPIAASIELVSPGAGSGDDAEATPEPPVVPDGTAIETIEGVVVAVEGDLTRTISFTLLTDAGDRIIFLPTATATFHGGPIAHIRDHLTSGAPVIVEYAVLADGTHAAISASDH